MRISQFSQVYLSFKETRRFRQMFDTFLQLYYKGKCHSLGKYKETIKNVFALGIWLKYYIIVMK